MQNIITKELLLARSRSNTLLLYNLISIIKTYRGTKSVSFTVAIGILGYIKGYLHAIMASIAKNAVYIGMDVGAITIDQLNKIAVKITSKVLKKKIVKPKSGNFRKVNVKDWR